MSKSVILEDTVRQIHFYQGEIWLVALSHFEFAKSVIPRVVEIFNSLNEQEKKKLTFNDLSEASLLLTMHSRANKVDWNKVSSVMKNFIHKLTALDRDYVLFNEIVSFFRSQEKNEKILRILSFVRKHNSEINVLYSRLMKDMKHLIYSFFSKIPLEKHLKADDYLQQGSLGVYRAVQLFRFEKNVPFVSYACYWIRHYIERFRSDQEKAVPLPVYLLKKVSKFIRFRRSFYALHGFFPTDSEICSALQLTEDEFITLRDAMASSSLVEVSFEADAFDSDADETPFIEVFLSQDPEQSPPTAEKLLEYKEMREMVVCAIEQLSPFERHIMKSKFIEGDSLEEVGAQYDLTKERIRQIIDNSIQKLSKTLNQKNEFINTQLLD